MSKYMYSDKGAYVHTPLCLHKKTARTRWAFNQTKRHIFESGVTGHWNRLHLLEMTSKYTYIALSAKVAGLHRAIEKSMTRTPWPLKLQHIWKICRFRINAALWLVKRVRHTELASRSVIIRFLLCDTESSHDDWKTYSIFLWTSIFGDRSVIGES